MTTTNVKVDAIFGGVSRQPSALRHAHQVEDASNAFFSVVDGFSKRDGSWFLRQITGLSGTDFRLHRIIRDGGERYIVVYGPSTLRVFELGGLEAIVDISDDAAAYLALNNPSSDQLRLCSEADTTFIVNTTVPTGVVQGLSYEVLAAWADYDVMTAQTPPIGSYHQTLAATSGHAAGYFQYQGFQGTDPATQAKITFPAVSGSLYADPSGYWDNSGGGPFGFRMGFVRLPLTFTAGSWDDSLLELTSTAAFSDYEWESGDRILINGGTNTTQGWATIASKLNDDTVVLSATIATDASDHADIGASGIGTEALFSYPVDSTTLASMNAVAARLQTLMRANIPGVVVGWTDTGVPSGPGRPALLRGYFTITSPYGGTGATITPPTAPGSGVDWTVAGTPFAATGSIVTAGTGSSVTNPTWLPVDAPNVLPGILDASKLPVKMTRIAKSYAPTSRPARFEVTAIEWNVRKSGTEDTNPAPTPFTREVPIRDLKFFQNRLVFCAGEFIVCSQTGDYYNFFLSDFANIVDSDPIAVTLSTDEITIIDYMVPYLKSMVLFTLAGRQFQFGFKDTLTPSSATITPTTSYTTLSTRPASMGSRLYFAASLGYDCQVLEYVFDEQSITSDAGNIASHVPNYLPANPRSFEIAENCRTIIVLPSGGYTLFVYRAFWTGDQKQQSAWSTYDFASDYSIADVVVIEDYCYMLVRRGIEWVMERICLASEPASCPIETVV